MEVGKVGSEKLSLNANSLKAYVRDCHLSRCTVPLPINHLLVWGPVPAPLLIIPYFPPKKPFSRYFTNYDINVLLRFISPMLLTLVIIHKIRP